MKPDTKPRTRNQVRKWLQNPQTDSAEYKMWGNSLAIPNAYHVLAGIAEMLREELEVAQRQVEAQQSLFSDLDNTNTQTKGATESEEQRMETGEFFTVRERRCKECGRILVSAASVRLGYGCQCAKKARKKLADQPMPGQMNLLDYIPTESEEN